MRWMVGNGAHERRRLKRGSCGCAFTETTLEDVVLAVVNPPQGERRLVDDGLARDADGIGGGGRARGVPERFAATDKAATLKWLDRHLQEITGRKRSHSARAGKLHRDGACRQFHARQFRICGLQPTDK